MMQKNAIIISASSDIGTAMCLRWKLRGWNVFGTYRSTTKNVEELNKSGVNLIHCDLSENKSVKEACLVLGQKCQLWDILVLCPGAQNPIVSFDSCDFDEWEKSIKVNFTNQLRILHELMPFRRKKTELEPCVLFFAGGGTNNATINYSAYTVSKISLIKMCELLDAEIGNMRFVILGPGWVKTKIHTETLNAGVKAGDNYQRTLDKLNNSQFTPIEDVLNCCDWLVDSPKHVVGGRNFSVVFDKWGTKELAERLVNEPDMYKLRRFGNDWLVKGS